MKIWCSVGDDYELGAYDHDTPCRHGRQHFPLREAKKVMGGKRGDFDLRIGNSWHPACLTDQPIEENFKITLRFPQTDTGRPSDEDINVVLKALEEAVKSEKFRKKVRHVLANDFISVVARTNVYWGY